MPRGPVRWMTTCARWLIRLAFAFAIIFAIIAGGTWLSKYPAPIVRLFRPTGWCAQRHYEWLDVKDTWIICVSKDGQVSNFSVNMP